MPVKVGDVFVPGGLPEVTYVPRADLQLEARVQDYLEERFKVLSLSGPTKSGKTVLVKRVASDAIWVSGGDVSTVTDFWKVLVDRLDGWIEVEKQRAKTDGESVTTAFDGELSAVVVKAGASGGTETTALDERVHTVRRDRLPAEVATDLLLLTKPVVVLDDFHYLGAAEQLKIVRGLRGMVFEGVPVILLGTAPRLRRRPGGAGDDGPRRAPGHSILGRRRPTHDRGPRVRRAERNRSDGDGWSTRAGELRQSVPHAGLLPGAMQGQRGAAPAGRAPRTSASGLGRLFHRRADATAKLAFEKLARGPRVRTKRIPRVLRDGRTVDIYNLVLEAIAHTGPKTTLTDTELRQAIRDIMAGEPPKSHEVTRVLEEMTGIARRGKGEPVVDYMADERQLHIADPFFAYYLRWHKPPATRAPLG